jgi:hypothetical protein
MRRESAFTRVGVVGVSAGVLIAVRVALLVLPYAAASRAAARWTRRSAWLPAQPADRIARRVERLARYVPGATCLPQAWAAVILLAWHGHRATVKLGVRKDGSVLRAHAWVEHQGTVIIGGDVKDFVAFESR